MVSGKMNTNNPPSRPQLPNTIKGANGISSAWTKVINIIIKSLQWRTPDDFTGKKMVYCDKFLNSEMKKQLIKKYIYVHIKWGMHN